MRNVLLLILALVILVIGIFIGVSLDGRYDIGSKTSAVYVREHGIDMQALAQVESSNNPKACHPQGCVYGRGLYAIPEEWLLHYNQANKTKIKPNDLFDPDTNERVANWYLDRLWRLLDGNDRDVLFAWDAGIDNLKKYQAGEQEMPYQTELFLEIYYKEHFHK